MRGRGPMRIFTQATYFQFFGKRVSGMPPERMNAALCQMLCVLRVAMKEGTFNFAWRTPFNSPANMPKRKTMMYARGPMWLNSRVSITAEQEAMAPMERSMEPRSRTMATPQLITSRGEMSVRRLLMLFVLRKFGFMAVNTTTSRTIEAILMKRLIFCQLSFGRLFSWAEGSRCAVSDITKISFGTRLL